MQRFLDKVLAEPMSGCWFWLGAVSKRGYGDYHFKGKTHRAHRVSWRIFKGEIPDKQCVLHKCDERLCVNPDHLFLGSVKDNQQDAANKGRLPRGKKHHWVKLTEQQVRTVLENPNHLTQCQLASDFNVCEATISHIINRKRWAWLI